MAEQRDQHLFTCNHEEAGARVVFNVCLKDTNCVVVSKDTDVFVLIVFAFANIGKVVKYLGSNLSLKFTHIHAITGCDTTLFMFSIGKVKMHETSPESQSFKWIWGDVNSLPQSASICIEIYAEFLLRWPENWKCSGF